jgi:hypothetical protein
MAGTTGDDQVPSLALLAALLRAVLNERAIRGRVRAAAGRP